jgi:uncharacterized protein (DUF302 family)
MITQMTRYGFGTSVALPYATAVSRVREELAQEGFGVLTEIDVAATLRQKLGVEMKPYVILGACNPPFAHRALTLEPEIGLLLPCNVVVYEGDTPGTTVVAAMDPEAALELARSPDMKSVALEVKERLRRALQRLDSSSETSAPRMTRPPAVP